MNNFVLLRQEEGAMAFARVLDKDTAGRGKRSK